MTITLNGTTGVTTPADTVTTITSPAATALTTQSAGTTAVTVDTSQNVGIGTTSPTAKLAVNGGTGNSQIRWEVNTSTYAKEVITNAAQNAYLYKVSDASYYRWDVGGSPSMLLDSSGNVGVGTTSPSQKLDVNGTILAGKSGTSVGYIGLLSGTSSNTGYAAFYNAAGTRQAYIGYAGPPNSALNIETDSGSNLPIRFATNAGYAGMFDTSGNLLVGATSAPSTFKVYAERSGPQYGLRHPSATAGQYFFMQTDSSNTFYIQSQAANGVYLTNTGTSWNAISDERAKDIIEPITDATTKVASLRAIIGSYKNDETKKRRAFLIAQDVQKVLPEAVDSENPDNLGLAYTDVIPLLVAAIQELSLKNEALEAANAAFETRLAVLEAK